LIKSQNYKSRKKKSELKLKPLRQKEAIEAEAEVEVQAILLALILRAKALSYDLFKIAPVAIACPGNCTTCAREKDFAVGQSLAIA
jgi:hypothetical protein